jgi:nucleotide-binding universal stress UspA family protein
MFKHILIPTDFGEPAAHALDVAVELAAKFDARISILHVYEATQPVPYGDGVVWPLHQIEIAARQMLDRLVDATRARGVACDGILKPGIPSDEITAAARDSGAELLVMGTHGRRGLSRFILGSTAERVVRTAPIPVLTISARGDAAPISAKPAHARPGRAEPPGLPR